jgi:hypothetical protein
MAMNVLEIKNVTRKDIPLYYRREFFGSVVFEYLNSKNEKRIDFSLENTPFGRIDVKVNFLEDVDYPLVPIVQSLKEYILDMDKKGGLP